MTGTTRSGARWARLTLLVGLCCAGTPPWHAAGQGTGRPEIWNPDYLQDLLVRQEEQLALFPARLSRAEEIQELTRNLVRSCEKAHQLALEQLAGWKADPESDERALKDAEDFAEETDLDQRARRKELLAASSSRDAVVAQRAELESSIAVVRSKLKALENQGEADWDDYLDARERHARSRLRAARAEQKQAECELEAAEAKVAAVRKKVEVSKAKTARAKEALENVNQEGKGPRLGGAAPGGRATPAA